MRWSNGWNKIGSKLKPILLVARVDAKFDVIYLESSYIASIWLSTAHRMHKMKKKNVQIEIGKKTNIQNDK